MLWYKSWLETRWRFLIGLVLLICSAAAGVLLYPELARIISLIPMLDSGGETGRRIRESAELARDYRGYLWSQWFGKSLIQIWTLFAVLLGAGGVLSTGPRGAALFTLSLPVSRSRLLGVRGTTALAELLLLAVVPSLLVPSLSAAIGQRYGVFDALIHSACLFISGAVFFSLAFLLSTVFTDRWRPLLIALSVAIFLGLCDPVFRELSLPSLLRVMSAEAYFRSGQLPWQGLIATAIASGAMLYGAALNIARRDF